MKRTLVRLGPRMHSVAHITLDDERQIFSLSINDGNSVVYLNSIDEARDLCRILLSVMLRDQTSEEGGAA